MAWRTLSLIASPRAFVCIVFFAIERPSVGSPEPDRIEWPQTDSSYFVFNVSAFYSGHIRHEEQSHTSHMGGGRGGVGRLLYRMAGQSEFESHGHNHPTYRHRRALEPLHRNSARASRAYPILAPECETEASTEIRYASQTQLSPRRPTPLKGGP